MDRSWCNCWQFHMWLIAQQIINTGTSKFHLEFPKSELKTMVCFFALHQPFPQRESERMRDAGALGAGRFWQGRRWFDFIWAVPGCKKPECGFQTDLFRIHEIRQRVWMQKLVQAAALQPIRSCTRELKLAIKVPDYISVMEIGKFYISHKKVVNGHNGGDHF